MLGSCHCNAGMNAEGGRGRVLEPQRKHRDQAGFRPSALEGECTEPMAVGTVPAITQLGSGSARRPAGG